MPNDNPPEPTDSGPTHEPGETVDVVERNAARRQRLLEVTDDESDVLSDDHVAA